MLHLDFTQMADSLARLDPALDFSINSLAIADRMLACLHQGVRENQVSIDQIHWWIVCAGAYFAEVLLRSFDVVWVGNGLLAEPELSTGFGRIAPFHAVRLLAIFGPGESLAAIARTHSGHGDSPSSALPCGDSFPDKRRKFAARKQRIL